MPPVIVYRLLVIVFEIGIVANRSTTTSAPDAIEKARRPGYKYRAVPYLPAYAGSYENLAYGVMTIELRDNKFQFDFHAMRHAVTRFHYERFDAADDEQDGNWSVSFRTSPAG